MNNNTNDDPDYETVYSDNFRIPCKSDDKFSDVNLSNSTSLSVTSCIYEFYDEAKCFYFFLFLGTSILVGIMYLIITLG